MREGVWDVVADKQEDTSSWKKQKDRAIAFIGLCLTNSFIHHIDFKSTAKQIWEHLESIFGNKIKNSKAFLKLQFYELQMEDSDDLSAHLAKMQSLVQQLSSLKFPLDDDKDNMVVLVKNVGKMYCFDNTL